MQPVKNARAASLVVVVTPSSVGPSAAPLTVYPEPREDKVHQEVEVKQASMATMAQRAQTARRVLKEAKVM